MITQIFVCEAKFNANLNDWELRGYVVTRPELTSDLFWLEDKLEDKLASDARKVWWEIPIFK